MKTWLLLFTLAFASVPDFALAEALQTSVPSAILIDADTRTVLFEKNADELETRPPPRKS